MAVVHRLRSEGARWLASGIDLLFPPRCGLCHEDIPCQDEARRESLGGTSRHLPCGFCEACARSLSTDVARCTCCGAVAGALGCRRCRTRRGWDGIVVLSAYDDRLRDAVLRAKRPAGEGIAQGLATLLYRRHEATLRGWGVDTVVPVPMHWLRRAARGASAAEELSRSLAALLGVPARPVLSRWRATRMQNELPVYERRGNVRDAFRARQRVDGRRILLVDDVVTTGSTLAACRRVLAAAGATAVFCAVIAVADRLADGGDA